MKRATVLLAAVLLAPGAFAAGAPAAGSAEAVRDCMRNNIPDSLRIQEFELTAVDRAKGKRVLKGKLYAKKDGKSGLVRAMLRILAPSDLANAAYLVREGAERDDMFVYLPALNRTRRITGSSADGPLFGTDLSYADIKQVQNAFSGGAVTLEGADTVDGRPAKRLDMVPRADAQSRYSRLKAWVDDKTCVALRTEFYEGAVLRKRLSANPKSLVQSGQRWYAAETEMRDLKDGTHTTLKITGVTSDPRLSDNLFNAATFYIGG